MRKFYALFLLSFLILLNFTLFNCGGGKEFIGTEYTDPVYNFEVKLPEGWKTFVKGDETRLRTVNTEYTRDIVRSEKVRLDGGVEIDPQIIIKVIPGNKDLNTYINDKVKNGHMTEYYTLFRDDVYRNLMEVTEEKELEISAIPGKANFIEIKESHTNPEARHPITHVYGYEIATIIDFVVFKNNLIFLD